jgi:phosphatidate cytidylyltransferase
MTRLISGVALAVVALAAILFLPVVAVRIMVALVAVLAAQEYLTIVGAADRDGPPHMSRAAPWLLLVAVTSWFLLLPGPNDVLWLVILGVAVMAIDVLFRGLTIGQAGTRFVAPWYVGMPLGLLAAVHARNGRAATLLLLATVVVSDTAQYYSGRAFGRRPLAPAISPKKTVEGAIGGAVFGTLFMALAGPRVLPGAPPLWLAVTGLAIVVLGICGDLFESRLKRVAGLKDSSSLIPGHGGILDRIDALLFATPAYYLFLQTVA